MRALFLLNNFSVYQHLSALELGRAWIEGLRFDIWAILWTMLPLLLISFLPSRWQGHWRTQKVLFGYVAVVWFFCIGLNVIDAELYKFTGKRLSIAWLGIQQDVQNQSLSLISYYWWLGGLGLIVWALSLKFWPQWSAKSQNVVPIRLRNAATAIFAAAILFLGLRGGWQLKPLSLAHAYALGSNELGVLSLNSTFSFFRSRSGSDSLRLRFFLDQEERREQVLAEYSHKSSSRHGQLAGRNVVILIIESLSSEYMGALNNGKGYTPFLDTLAQKGLLFGRNMANGRRSIEAMPSVICGMPSLMSEALLLSPYQGVQLHCMPQLAKGQGYSTWFFHGAHNGSMHFDTFAARSGFQKYVGLNEYPNRNDSDGHWGIFDEPFLKHSLELLDQSERPFLATIFTLSSHHPYPIPEKLKGRFPKGTLEIHESIGYVDWALAEFFAAASTKDWFQNTLFVITGDHTQKSDQKEYANRLGGYRVPLLLYAPGADLTADLSRWTQHVDIPATVADLLGWKPEPAMWFGQSVFSQGESLAYNGDESGFWLVFGEHMVEYLLAKGEWRHYELSMQGVHPQLKGAPAANNASDKAAEALKAVVDYFNQGIVENRLYR